MNISLACTLYGVTAVVVFIGAYSSTKKDITGAKPLALLCAVVALYTFGYAWELVSTTFHHADFWGKFKYAGLPFIPAALLILSLSFSKRNLGVKEMLVIFAVPAATALLRMTNESHYLLYSSVSFESNGYFDVIRVGKGIWYYVQYAYFLICIGASLKSYASVLRNARGYKRNQIVILMLSTVMPVLNLALNLFGKAPLGIDFGAFVVIFGNIMFTYGIFRYNFMHIVPMSRKKVFDWIHDGILVIDPNLVLLDYNNAAQNMFRGLNRKKIGIPVDESLTAYSGFVSGIKDSMDRIVLESDSKAADKSYQFSICDELSNIQKDYSLRIARLSDRHSLIGATIMVTDITRQNRILKKLEFAANSDYLTGLVNRRHFFEVAAHETDKSCSQNKPVSVILFDIDHFKDINDRWGHQAGDKVLVELARLAEKSVRDIDVVARYGGEEFIVFLPGAENADSIEIAERIRSRLESHCVEWEGDVIRLTASFGVSTFGCVDYAPDHIDKMISRADTALYKAKENGRNRVEAFQVEMGHSDTRY